MSFKIFKRKNKKENDTAKRFEHQEYLAKFEPTNVVDYSECNLEAVPSGTFILCNVWLKEVLIVHSNRLKSLKEDGTYEGFVKLVNLRILDVHNNQISEIPIEISFVINLQIVNLENNQLRSIPSALCSLKFLQTLNLKKNFLKELPENIGDLKSLRTLDISLNPLTSLPKSICQCQCMEICILDAEKMQYPDRKICQAGISEILKFICADVGCAYVPASTVVLNLMKKPQEENNAPPLLTSNLSRSCDHIDTALITNYQQMKDEKAKEALLLQQELMLEQERQARLIAQTNADRSDLLSYITQENVKLDAKLISANEKHEIERKKMLEILKRTEESSTSLIQELLDINKESHKREELLEANEILRLQEEGAFKIKLEEYENLKKQEVRRALETQMMQIFSLEQLQRMQDANRTQVLREFRKCEADDAATLNSLMHKKDADIKNLCSQMLRDEEFQKRAVLSLMEERDARVNRINEQLEMIQCELAHLSLIEMSNRDVRDHLIQARLDEQRVNWTKMMVLLMEEKGKRTKELKKRLVEMELQRMEEQTDYWLAQYQRLLDTKPETLSEMERKMDDEVVAILTAAGAQIYLPAFARRRVTLKQLLKFTESDLQSVPLGIYDATVRRRILQAIEGYKSKNGVKSKHVDVEPPKAASAATSPTSGVVQARFEMECVVCMTVKCDMVFLPCGHVCCCQLCGESLDLCPLCRAEIQQKVNLQHVEPTAPIS